jgi:hypothetical protein
MDFPISSRFTRSLRIIEHSQTFNRFQVLPHMRRFVMDGSYTNAQLIHFLQNDLQIPANCIALALRRCQQQLAPLHMILWQYGLVSLDQLQQIFIWLEGSTPAGATGSRV